MKENPETLGALYIYIYIAIFLQKRKNTFIQLSKITQGRKFQKYQNIKHLLTKAYNKISFSLYVKKKIGYIQGVNYKENVYKMKEIKLLHDSLSFL